MPWVRVLFIYLSHQENKKNLPPVIIGNNPKPFWDYGRPFDYNKSIPFYDFLFFAV